jgi:hypothetical protein
MKNFDVFNGDADGLCAIHQFRLANPEKANLVTGTKHDKSLLKNINVSRGDGIVVMDLPLDSNYEDILRLLDEGAKITYFDHHSHKNTISNDNFSPYIDLSSNTCTSIIVNDYLSGAYKLWAIVGAFGDNIRKKAFEMSEKLGLSNQDTHQLSILGEYLNYNSYGLSMDDLHISPYKIYDTLSQYDNPFKFMSESSEFEMLKHCIKNDYNNANQIQPLMQNDKLEIYILPDASWARRINGSFANQLANMNPEKAHAILTPHKGEENYLVNLRAPLVKPEGADKLCVQFSTGGGRQGAAGINKLLKKDMKLFFLKLINHFTST